MTSPETKTADPRRLVRGKGEKENEKAVSCEHERTARILDG